MRKGRFCTIQRRKRGRNYRAGISGEEEEDEEEGEKRGGKRKEKEEDEKYSVAPNSTLLEE